MEALAPAAALMLLVTKLIEWARQFVPYALTGKILIPASMAVSVGLVFLFGASPTLAANIPVWDGATLADTDMWAKIAWGMCIGAGAGTVFDIAKRPLPGGRDDDAEH